MNGETLMDPVVAEHLFGTSRIHIDSQRPPYPHPPHTQTRFHELGLDAEVVAGRITGGPPTLGSARPPDMTEPRRLASTAAVPARKTWHRPTHAALDASRVGSSPL
ncbi:hypothetical protein ACFQ6S_29925 [Streptomyces sp. NPDC056479]|uniref:hypothetical protein n=1 Tax=Streptomyces sp. NPDC056479 TaxID=3345832 RepID=UPI0036CD93B1